MIHLSKLCVGIRDVSHLQGHQASRVAAGEVLQHRTRMAPRRAAELLAGGSIYWTIAGQMLVRQRLLGIEAAMREDGTACTALLLDAELVPVAARAVRAFQGWRYLAAGDAPPDLADAPDLALGDLPESLRRELRVLALI